MELTLLREYHPTATNGQLMLAKKRICFTIELPWRQNRNHVSCIPEGRYQLVKRYTPRFGWHLRLLGAKHCDAVYIHAADDVSRKIKGCILPVTKCTGVGKGILGPLALYRLVSIVDAALQRQPVFLIIKTKTS